MDPYYSELVEMVSVGVRNAYKDTQKDPVANIREQAETARRVLWDLAQNLPPSRRDARKLAELVLGLDEWRKRGGFDPYTARADAKLVAAAPDLLKALRTMLVAHSSICEGDGDMGEDEDCARARAAIAKAEGRERC